MKLLLTNDDGIDAPGLAALEAALEGIGELTVVAPHEHLSGCGHRTVTDRPLHLREVGARRFALDGTPADCTRLGLLYAARESDWVVSGVNDGGNLGVDVFMSGTVAAVREAALFGRPGVAFSQYRRRGNPACWEATLGIVQRVFAQLCDLPLEPGAFWNVNLPDGADTAAAGGQPEVVFCPLEPAHLHVAYELAEDRYHFRGNYQDRPRTEGSDVAVCFSGRVAITKVYTHPSGQSG